MHTRQKLVVERTAGRFIGFQNILDHTLCVNVLLVVVLLIRVRVHIIDQEGGQWFDHIFVHIEQVVRHSLWRDKRAWAEAALLQLAGVLYRDQNIFLAMHNESRASDSVHFAQIVELLSEQAAKESDFCSGDTLD